jgi:hypothetical protein
MASLRWNAAFWVMLAAGCASPDEGESAGESGAATEASTGGSTSGSSAGEGSLSMTGASASQTGAATTTAGEESSSGAQGTTGAGTSGSGGATTAAGDPCAGLSMEECMDDRACTAITCQPYVAEPTSGTVCIGEREYIGCHAADLGCDDARTHTCEGADATVYVCANSCIPEDWMLCEPPVMGARPCG